jgi:hypothetical protein
MRNLNNVDPEAHNKETIDNTSHEVKDEHTMLDTVEIEDAQAPEAANMTGVETVLSKHMRQIKDDQENEKEEFDSVKILRNYYRVFERISNHD